MGIELIPLGPDDPVSAGEIRLRGCLGEGGMGRVYLGLTQGGRPVAVKLVKDPFAKDPEFRSRFAREAANAAKVSGIFTAPVLSHDAQAERLGWQRLSSLARISPTLLRTTAPSRRVGFGSSPQGSPKLSKPSTPLE